MENSARLIQDKINALQEELHDEIEKINKEADEQRNNIYAERKNKIMDLISKHKLPHNFWAQALVNALKKPSQDDAEMNEVADTPEFLGPYDVELILNHLINIDVLYKGDGLRITFTFTANNYFKESELWAECYAITHDNNANTANITEHDIANNDSTENNETNTNNHETTKNKDMRGSNKDDDKDDNNNNDDDEDNDDDDIDGDDYDDRERRWVFSGITWNDGYGPSISEEEPEEEVDNAINTQDNDGDIKLHKEAHLNNTINNNAHKRIDRQEFEESSKRTKLEPDMFDQAQHNKEKDNNDNSVEKIQEIDKQSVETTTNTNSDVQVNKCESVKRGPSVLDVFSIMPPYPMHDDELLEKDEDGEIDEQLMCAAVEAWNDEMDDRETLLLDIIVNSLFVNPIQMFTTESTTNVNELINLKEHAVDMNIERKER